MVCGLGLRVGLGFRVWRLGFAVCCLGRRVRGFRVEGLGFTVHV